MAEPDRRLPSDVRFRYALEDLIARVRNYREHMTITREDLKAKRLKAMGVIGAQTQATSDMFDRVIAYGDKVAEARTAAEAAQTGALDSQIADLKEMADDLADFGNAAASPPLLAGTKPAAVGAPVTSGALAALNGAQPNPKDWTNGDAYVGTHPEAKT